MENDESIPILIDETVPVSAQVPVTILTGYLGRISSQNSHGLHGSHRCGQNDSSELHSHGESPETHRSDSEWIRSGKRHGTSTFVQHEWEECHWRSSTLRRLAWTPQRLFVLFRQVGDESKTVEE